MQRTWLTPTSTLAASLFVLAGAAGAGCIGDIGAPDEGLGVDPPGPGPQSCAEGPQPGDAPIRRMTRFEYNNTVRDLLGDTTNPADGFAAEEEALGFNNNAANLTTSAQLAEKYMLAAEGISERATADLASLLPCDPGPPGGMNEEQCAKDFIDDFVTRAYRRPLTADEKATFLSLWQIGKAETDFTIGAQLVIQAALQAPAFLYRVEFGLPADGDAAVVGLDDWEMASRLSYMLWGSMPDDELFAAAEAGELSTKEQVAAQARRMVELPQARDSVRNFHQQWLDYDRIANVGKSAELFPDWSSAIGQLMREETETFLDQVIFEGEGDLEALLTAPYSYMNAELAEFYGVDAMAGEDFVRVDLDPKERAGLLTLGTLLTINAHSNQTSPVHRGKLVREQFLCDLMPPPPADVMITVPEPDPTSSARERFAQHSEDEACSGCHVLMDPLGFGFENYDAIARFRTEENNEPIDASGTITASDVNGNFVGAVGLAKKLAGSQDVQSCYAKQWFRYAYGRGETKGDSCTTGWLDAKFAESGGKITELLVALTQTDAFFYRPAGGMP
jgi:hypothetical protein